MLTRTSCVLQGESDDRLLLALTVCCGGVCSSRAVCYITSGECCHVTPVLLLYLLVA